MSDMLADALAEAGIDFIAAFPSSTLAELQRRLEEDRRFKTVFVSNEGEGVGVCGGAWLAGKQPALIMENSGLSVASYALIRLNAAYEIPLLMILDYRGDIGDGNWWAVPFGWSCVPLLSALRVSYAIADDANAAALLVPKLWRTSQHSKHPAALLLRYGMALGAER